MSPFKFQQLVKIVGGFHAGEVGIVVDELTRDGHKFRYKVRLTLADTTTYTTDWMLADTIEAYETEY